MALSEIELPGARGPAVGNTAPAAAESSGVAAFYDEYYSGPSAWRALQALDRVRDIVALCGDRPFEHVLEVGAGEGSVLRRLDEVGFAPNLYGLEISESGVAAIRQQNIESLRAAAHFDGYSIPYPDRHFDLVIATHVLEHVEHERLFLRELGRVAKNLFIEVPLEDTTWMAHNLINPVGHVNFYRRETVLNLFRTVDLAPVRWEIMDYSLGVACQQSGRVKGTAKHLIRRGLLHATPRIGQRFLTYYLAAFIKVPTTG